MALSKTTTNKARRLSLHLIDGVFDSETCETRPGFEICQDNDGEPEDEYVAIYAQNIDGSFSYQGSCSVHDCPAHIANEQELRDLLPEFAKL